MTNKKTIAYGIGILIIGMFLISMASAEYVDCFNKGQQYKYCDPVYQHKADIYQPNCGPTVCTCSGTQCTLCVKSYNEEGDCYVPGNSGVCLKLTPTCSDLNGNATYDLTDPVLTITSPVNDPAKYYSSKKVALTFSVNEMSDVFYRDLNKNTATWTKVCTGCSSYTLNRSFSEGENNLVFKAVDMAGNDAEKTIIFNVDSVAPRIYKTYPLTGFADGAFEVQFKELNTKRVTLNYGGKTKNLNLADCYNLNGKTFCEIDVSLEEFNGQTIPYYFEVEDVVGRTYKSRAINLKVDTKDPVVNNINSFFKTNGRYAIFNISITDANFYKVTYTEISSPNAVKVLCTKLVNGNCVKQQSFLKGAHSISVQIWDKAGHSIAVPVDFNISY